MTHPAPPPEPPPGPALLVAAFGVALLPSEYNKPPILTGIDTMLAAITRKRAVGRRADLQAV